MNMNRDYLKTACELMPHIDTLSKMYSKAKKEELNFYDDDDEELSIVGSVASTIEAIDRYKGESYNNNDLLNESKKSRYISFLENELRNLLLDIYHVHKNEFDEFANDASQLVTDDIISSMMMSNR